MTLFEINKAIMNCIKIDENVVIDTETGEVFDEDYLNNLQISRDEKRENIAKWIKNLDSDIEQLTKQKQHFDNRIKSAKNKQEWLKNYLAADLNGDKWESKDKAVSVTWRKSEVVYIPDETDIPKKWFIKQDPKLDKAGIKKAIKSGTKVRGASIVTKNNMQIK